MKAWLEIAAEVDALLSGGKRQLDITRNTSSCGTSSCVSEGSSLATGTSARTFGPGLGHGLGSLSVKRSQCFPRRLTCESVATIGESGVRMPATVPLPLSRSA